MFVDRRQFFGSSFASVALAAMLHRDGYGGVGAARRQAALPAEGQDRHLALHERRRLAMETFDPKPELTKYAGKTIGETPYKTCRIRRSSSSLASSSSTTPTASSETRFYPLQVGFKKYGKSGIEVSDWLPHTGQLHRRHRRHPLDVHDRRQPRCADAVPHRPAHARRRVPDARRLGALRPRHAQREPAAVHHHGQARVLEREGRPLSRPGSRRGADPRRSGQSARLRQARRSRCSAAEQKIGFDLVGKLNKLQGGRVSRRPGARRPHQVATNWPSACRNRCPRCSTSPRRPRRRKKLYGLDRPETRDFGMQLLACRRLVERGVRFIQVQHGAGGAGVWDAHGGLKSQSLEELPGRSTSRSPGCSRT